MADDEPEPAEGGLVALDADGLERVADGNRVRATLHQPGEEEGEIERTEVDVRCVGGTPDDTDSAIVAGIGMTFGIMASGIAIEATGADPSGLSLLGAGLFTLGVMLFAIYVERTRKRLWNGVTA